MLKNKKLLIASLIGMILVLACILVFGFIHFKSYNENIEKANKITSIYEDSKIDFVVPSPSLQQIEDLKNEEHIDDVFPCYSVYTNLKLGQRDVSTYILLLNSHNELDNTFFKEDRIKSSTGNLSDNSIVIDESFALQYHLSLGDKVTWSLTATFSVELVVDRIYYENTIDDVKAIAFNLGQQNKQIEELTKNNPLVPSNAYIDSSDISKTEEFLKTYQPLGLKRTPEEFDTYTEYEQYLSEFNNVDYFLQIKKVGHFKTENFSKADMYFKNAETQLWLFVIILFVCSFVISFVIDLICRVSNNIIFAIQENGSRLSYLISFVVVKLIVAFVCALSCAIFTATMLKSFPEFSILSTIPVLLGMSISIIIEHLLIKKATKVKTS